MIDLLHGDLVMFDKDECKDSQTSHYSIKIIYCPPLSNMLSTSIDYWFQTKSPA